MTNLERIEAQASVVGQHDISSISVTEAERMRGSLDPEKLAEARAMFIRNGYLRVENLFTAAQMAALDSRYRSRNAGLLSGTNKRDKRPLFTVRIEDAFNDANVLANPLILPFLAGFLGEDFIVAAVSAVASFPGAPDQYLHRDARQLFSEDNETDKDLPVVTMTMLVPLIDFTTETGCTRVWPGSHRIAGREAGLAVGSLDPEVRVGSVLITDGRVLHRGAANRSDRLRPLFYMTYHRAWFRDFGGYERRPPIILPEAEYRKMPAELRARFDWFRDRYAGIRRSYWLRRVLPASIRMRISTDI